MSNKIPIGISACLMGEKVRFDGGHRRLAFAMDDLAPFVHFEPICPEMAIGLPSPRPALRLVKDQEGQIGMYSGKSPDEHDLTEAMVTFSARQSLQLAHLSGYIVCAKSPSCGMERVRVYDRSGSQKNGVGLFTQALMRQLPWLPVEENGRLNDPALRENFVARVFTLFEFNQLMAQPLTRGGLMAFHRCYKLLLLAHSQPLYRQLGPFVAAMDQWDSLELFAMEYRNRLMALLANSATRPNHTNVLMHVQGYFRRHLTFKQRQELALLIDSYRQGLQPLLAPITLLKHYMAEYPDAWLAQQRYFEPYPEALRLRYGH
ncbi:2-thiouracil desulfurase family protein [Acerihabitans sp. TG2]|uniref:YbgA family protein n=1 Tax=Acerihabitans sp. TG2 TaxID=3096008 RepID=UPI002B23E9DF|nr:2-thiouracil desulfurase family protein [Acerihabitans sp. TG2]MEA9392294.1 2-thiouracil desulfurase family protein [Acerihabitans sp. TG2]